MATTSETSEELRRIETDEFTLDLRAGPPSPLRIRGRSAGPSLTVLTGGYIAKALTRAMERDQMIKINETEFRIRYSSTDIQHGTVEFFLDPLREEAKARQSPGPEEVIAAVAALHALRERSRTALRPWPTIEEEVVAALNAASRSLIWHPIDTAPKDGTVVLGCQGEGDDYQVFEMVWGDWDNRMDWRHPGYAGRYRPTHWSPRPAPP